MKKKIVTERKAHLVNAAYFTIGETGLNAITLSDIAKKAGLSTGLVSHYFGDKQGILHATMRKILCDLQQAVRAARHQAPPDAISQLKAIVRGNFDVSQTNQNAMRTWLDFWAASMRYPNLQRLQRINDRRLYSNLYWQFFRLLRGDEAQRAALGLAALIDGLWLRGSLRQEDFNVAQAINLANHYIDQQLCFGQKEPCVPVVDDNNLDQ
ncbi:transcriptional regulator BetI [Bartonella sp. DGB2]|uniref:transcriptional regulator BetI n=1 Tax=Bartonella sp. DGB2 TaxID=3388426 RepID=UPI00398FE4C6